MREPRPPILADKLHEAPFVFTPESLLREAGRQKGLAAVAVPEVRVLDPDGDLVRHVVAAGRTVPNLGWACYHTAVHTVTHVGLEGQLQFLMTRVASGDYHAYREELLHPEPGERP